MNSGTGAEEVQPEWSQFSRRLASFGLGEAPDPLLTRVPPLPQPSPRQRNSGDLLRRP
jgi:hypothetical protein